MLFYLPYMMSIVLDVGYVKPLIKMLHNPITHNEEEFNLQVRGGRIETRGEQAGKGRKGRWGLHLRYFTSQQLTKYFTTIALLQLDKAARSLRLRFDIYTESRYWGGGLVTIATLVGYHSNTSWLP